MRRDRKARSYGDAGVKTGQEAGLGALVRMLEPTQALRRGRPGSSVLPIGYFANVVDIGNGLGLALTTDGVGTKILVAEMLGRYETIGIDCVAMNVNDVICVGAEPITMLDYLAVEVAREDVLLAVGRGLAEGATEAGVNIVGGELSQMAEVIKGHGEGTGLDLVGMCAGLVKLEEINIGQDVAPGDLLIGLASSGIHSNGLTLARRVLLEGARMKPTERVADLGRSVGEELLEPTRIYVRVIRELMSGAFPLKAMVHITGDGLLNLLRIQPDVSFKIEKLPEPQPIFGLIQRLGEISNEEMYRVFNMGIGFCVVLPPRTELVGQVRDLCRRHGIETTELGVVTEGPERQVRIEPLGIVGEGDRFTLQR